MVEGIFDQENSFTRRRSQCTLASLLALELSGDLPKPLGKFVTQILLGIQASQDATAGSVEEVRRTVTQLRARWSAVKIVRAPTLAFAAKR